VALIMKPFTVEALAQKVADVLSGDGTRVS
jgi:hypothetical protein